MTITHDDNAKHLGVTQIEVSRSFTTPDQVREPLSAQRVPSDAYGYHGTVVHDQWVGGNEWNWSSPVTFEAGKR